MDTGMRFQPLDFVMIATQLYNSADSLDGGAELGRRVRLEQPPHEAAPPTVQTSGISGDAAVQER
jgi:hypothetical protein